MYTTVGFLVDLVELERPKHVEVDKRNLLG